MKHLLVFLLLLCSANVSAQDVIVKKDGSTIVCRVVELTSTEITYKKWSDLNGSNYVMDRSLASAINYENGKKEVLGEQQSQYTPGNQNDGVQQYNDRALLAMDYAASNPYKKVKTLKTIGWIGGAALVTAGAICASIWSDSEDLAPSLAIMGGGAVFTTTFLIIANNKKKRIRSLQSSAVYQHNINFNNGSSLSAGIDILSDHNVGSNTLGLGLRYNF